MDYYNNVYDFHFILPSMTTNGTSHVNVKAGTAGDNERPNVKKMYVTLWNTNWEIIRNYGNQNFWSRLFRWQKGIKKLTQSFGWSEYLQRRQTKMPSNSTWSFERKFWRKSEQGFTRFWNACPKISEVQSKNNFAVSRSRQNFSYDSWLGSCLVDPKVNSHDERRRSCWGSRSPTSHVIPNLRLGNNRRKNSNFDTHLYEFALRVLLPRAVEQLE